MFCPFKPVSRRLKDNAQNFQVGAKRQRTNSSGGSDAQITAGKYRAHHVFRHHLLTHAAELAHKIKMETAHQFTDLLNKGLHQDHILRMFAMTSATYGPRNGIAAHNGSVPNTPTTAPATAHTMKNEGTPGLYSIQHDRFNGGDLVHTQTQGLVRQYASPYSDNFQAPGGDTKPPDDNINVGAASVLQNMAQSAATEAVTAAGNYGSLITTAGSNMAMPATSGPNVHDTLLNDLSATYPQLQAQANTAPDAGFPAVNSGIAENMPLYQSHVLPSQGPSESIAVGATEAEEAPPLALRKDGKPRKKQPKRVQPPRNSM